MSVKVSLQCALKGFNTNVYISDKFASWDILWAVKNSLLQPASKFLLRSTPMQLLLLLTARFFLHILFWDRKKRGTGPESG